MTAKYTIEMRANGRRYLTPTTEPCICTDGKLPAGTQPGRKTCPTCKGTGNGPRGGKGRCRECSGYKTVADYEHPVTCTICQGTGSTQATRYSNVPGLAVELGIPLRFVRQNRGVSFNESYLGLGIVHGVSGTGDLRRLSDARLWQYVMDDLRGSFTQIFALVKPDGEVASELAVILHNDGYSVRAVWVEDDSAIAVAARELSEDAGLIVGTMVYEAGGNGTIAAATVLK